MDIADIEAALTAQGWPVDSTTRSRIYPVLWVLLDSHDLEGALTTYNVIYATAVGHLTEPDVDRLWADLRAVGVNPLTYTATYGSVPAAVRANQGREQAANTDLVEIEVQVGRTL